MHTVLHSIPWLELCYSRLLGPAVVMGVKWKDGKRNGGGVRVVGPREINMRLLSWAGIGSSIKFVELCWAVQE